MAHHNNVNNINTNTATQHLAKPVFHDFLGMKPADSLVVLPPKPSDARLSEPSPSSASVSGGPRGPFSTTSDIASEKQVRNHLEGVPFYGPRSDFSGTALGNRLVGNKRSHSESIFMGSSRDAFQMVPDSVQNSHLMKMLRSTAGGEQHRGSNDGEVFLGMQPMKPTSVSQMFQLPAGTKIDANKWEQSIVLNPDPSMHHPPRGAQLTSFVHQIASNKIRDPNIGSSFVSQLAADEGSRTGIKGLGILSSINTATAVSEKASSAVLLGGVQPKPASNTIDLESSTPLSRHELRSANCQMTIFYGGQAHVFDDVHPNKADVIMNLAGSNGGSWSTTTKYSPKPPQNLLHHTTDIESGQLHAISTPPPPGPTKGSVVAKDTRSSVQVADSISQDKRRAQ